MSSRARQLIAENRRSRATSLDLGNCGLTEIPAEIAEMVWLKSLTFSNILFSRDESKWTTTVIQRGGHLNSFNNLAPLLSLNALEALSISDTNVSNLEPLCGLASLQLLDVAMTKVTNLEALSDLVALQELYAFETNVSTLSALSRLDHLRLLHLSGTRVTDLAPLANLAALETLYLDNTGISDLRALAGLPDLKWLDVSSTRVNDISALARLPGLTKLNIYKTKVVDLSPLTSLIRRGCPVKWTGHVSYGDGIYVKYCPLTNPPPEIVNQGNEAILSYFQERQLGEVDHLYEAKLLILGEGGAGKTSLLRRLYQPDQPLPMESETTKGIVIHRHDFALKNGRRFRLNVWDFGGQEIYHATHQFFLTSRSLYLLVDDTRNDYKSVSDKGFKYWLDLIDAFGGHSPVLIFQNEKGGRTKAIDIAGIKGRYDNVKDRYSSNLELTNAANALRDEIEHFASHLAHIGDELPARWIKVREEIEVLAEKKPHISQQDYFEIYGRYLEFDRSKALHLSQYLHDLGVFLHFQKDSLLARTVILQNQWATEAVFRILDDETVKANQGRFNSADCERLWLGSVYADMHPELLALMKRFELCYELRDTSPPEWLAPQLLLPAKPEALENISTADDLVLRYCYPFLPKGVISRLMVRLHRFVREPKMSWSTGVLFEHERTSALVELLSNGTEIELRVRGPESKALLNVVSADLDALNESFEGLRDKIDKLIPCHCKTCLERPVPHFFEQRELLGRKEHNKLTIECKNRPYEDVSVLELLDGVRPDKLPNWAQEPIRIFLASSSELREDRDAFDLHLQRRNDQLRKAGRLLEVVRWEYSLDAMSSTRLQDEYNKQVRQSDIFVSLFFTKAGKYTEEEFDAAHAQFQRTGRPSIYTYFKDAPISTGSARKQDLNSMWAFKERLESLGHYPTTYTSIPELKLHFGEQLDKILRPFLQPK